MPNKSDGYIPEHLQQHRDSRRSQMLRLSARAFNGIHRPERGLHQSSWEDIFGEPLCNSDKWGHEFSLKYDGLLWDHHLEKNHIYNT